MRSILRNMPTEKVKLEKQNGEVFEDIVALVQSKSICTEDIEVPIEEGDKFIRNLPNGLNEIYMVLDRGFHQAFGGIPSHYQVKVKKESEQNFSKTIPQTIIVNNHGQYSKTNLNSIDNSVNNYNNQSEIFGELKKLVSNIPEEDRLSVIESINDMEESCGKEGFVDKYNSFIQSAANHMTVFAPLIPMLTTMLIK